jgi:hypothetical protein
MADELRYLVTINGINVGTFSTYAEADNQSMVAASKGVGGYTFGVSRLVEIRDIKNGYQVVGRRTV